MLRPTTAWLAWVVVVAAAILVSCGAPAARVTIQPGATASTLPAATGTPTAAPTASFPLTITDDEDTTVTIPAEPQRIVSLTPATTEILFAIGADERVVATTDFDDYPPDAVSLPNVASYTSVDVEKIVGLQADLVVAGGNAFTPPDGVRRLRSLGIPTVVVYGATVDDVFADIELTGVIAGRAAPARDLATTMRADFERVAAALAAEPRPRVF